MSWHFELLLKPGPGSLPRPTNEGPVWDGEYLYFTQVHENHIMRFDPKNGSFTEWRTGVNKTNGLAFDAQGRLFACCAGGRSILRFDPDGRNAMIADRIDGKKLNTPNDLAIDRKGRVWFTNSWGKANCGPDDRQEVDESVVRLDPKPDGSYSATQVTFDATHPNGILVSQDQSTLYVAESGYEKEVVRELRAYPIKADGSLGGYRTLFTWGGDEHGVHRGIDGMCLDAEGNIIACTGWNKSGAGPMLYVISPQGRVLETHPVPAEQPTNCCFGGPDMTTLYVTTVQYLFQVKTNRVGWAMYP